MQVASPNWVTRSFVQKLVAGPDVGFGIVVREELRESPLS